MKTIEVLESGHVDRRDSAFPTLVQLEPGGDIICGYNVGGGPHALGGTECSLSTDGGRSWRHQSVVLAPGTDVITTNHLRLSGSSDGAILAYGQRDQRQETAAGSKQVACDAVWCRSTDGGASWSPVEIIDMQMPGPYEISNPIVITDDGRWLAPAASYHAGRYGERVVLHESGDQGKTWPKMYTVFQHPQTKFGYLEQKVITCGPGQLLAVAWVQDFENDNDLKNVYSFSADGGRTWNGPHTTGIQGQTMTPIWLGDDRFLVLYNRRFGEQSVQMCLVRTADSSWALDFEGTLWSARSTLELTSEISSQEEIRRIQFGYPMGVRLDQETVLTVHWCVEEGVCGIRWTRLRVVYD